MWKCVGGAWLGGKGGVFVCVDVTGVGPEMDGGCGRWVGHCTFSEKHDGGKGAWHSLINSRCDFVGIYVVLWTHGERSSSNVVVRRTSVVYGTVGRPLGTLMLDDLQGFRV